MSNFYRDLIKDGDRNASRVVPLPTTAFIRPCQRIEIEADEDVENGRQTIAVRYAALTTDLPLAGASTLRRTTSGEIAMMATLRAEVPWFTPAIDHIERALELQLALGQPWVSFPPLLMTGAPGVGKSWFARRVAELAGTGTVTANLAGSMDSCLVAGNPRGWSATQPCLPALAMNQTKTANPICVVEEAEKAGGSERHGDPIAALLMMLDRGSAANYYDACLLAAVDISHANWLITANAVTPRLPQPFLSRVTVVDIAPPPVAAFDDILARLVTAFVHRHRLPTVMTPVLPPAAAHALRADFARHRSIRRLSQMFERIVAHCLPERVTH